MRLSHLAATAMRHHVCERCPEGFPRIFSSRADAEKHREGGNTPLRYGGTEEEPRHTLAKALDPLMLSGRPATGATPPCR
jgi:hypothetical protein